MLKEISNLQFGDFTLDRRARVLRRLETVLPVTGKAFDLLTYMVENPGRPLSKSELLEAVWPETNVEESNLSQNVFLLRKVLGSGADGPIKTLPGRGYQFVAQVSEMQVAASFNSYALPAQSSSVRLEATHSLTIVEKDTEEHVDLSWRAVGATVVAIALAIGVGIGTHKYFSSKALSPPPAPAKSEPANRPAVAVLGFRNASSRPEDAWLSTAIAEMVATEMGSGDKVRVISNEEVARVQSGLETKAGSPDLPADRTSLQHATGADMLVQGSYVVAGGQGPSPGLRLMVQVEDAHSGKQIASFAETGKIGGLFALVDQAGTELRKDLSDTSSDTNPGQALAGMSQSTDAMRFYAEGVDQARHFDPNSARGLFERAIQEDPKFALAHLGLADTWTDLGFMERATKEAEIAYKLSTDLPRVQRLAIEAEYRSLSNDSEHAITLYKALSTFYPDDETWSLRLAEEQDGAGRQHDAIDTFERLRRLSLTPAQAVDVAGREGFLYSELATQDGAVKARNLEAEAVSIAAKQNSLLVRGEAYRTQCAALAGVGPVPDAERACKETESTFRAAGNLEAVAAAVNNLASLASGRGDWKEAEADYTEARRIFHDLGDIHDEYSQTYNLCLTHLQTGDLNAAIKDCTLLSKAHDTGDDGYFNYYGSLYAGTAYLYLGSLQEARSMATAAEHAAEKETRDGAAFDLAMAKELLATLALDEGDLNRANAIFEEASVVLKPTKHEIFIADLATDQAEVLVEDGHPTQSAANVLRNTIATLRTVNQEVNTVMKADIYLARMDMASNAGAEAARALADAKTLDGKNTWEDSHLQLLLAEAALQRSVGHAEDAKKLLQQEITEAQSKRYSYLDFKGEIDLARLTLKTSPSPENTVHLRSIGQQADHAGFKGLARQAFEPQV